MYIRDASGNTMGIIRNTQLSEIPIYGSSRLGQYQANEKEDLFAIRSGQRRYEFSNHLGNVLVTLNDAGNVLSYSDYYPFGLTMEDRSWGGVEGGKEYRYGFNGKENDTDLSSSQLIQDYGFRVYNPVIGKFLSVDPLTKSYPWYTPYQFAGNTPIQAIDLDGLEEFVITSQYFADFFLDKEYLNSIYISEKQKHSITTWLHGGKTSKTFDKLFMTYHVNNKEAIQMVDEKAPFKVSVKNANMYLAEELTMKFQNKFNVNSNDYVGFGLGPVNMADMPISTIEANESKVIPAAMYGNFSLGGSILNAHANVSAGKVIGMKGNTIHQSKEFHGYNFSASEGENKFDLEAGFIIGFSWYSGDPYDYSLEGSFLGKTEFGGNFSIGNLAIELSISEEDEKGNRSLNFGVGVGKSLKNKSNLFNLTLDEKTKKIE
ncbi:RHS repeat domain-containing protein [Flammeovirga sp. EKP202]|uniref:RHS repeat domain-containing protein n=1 Tax=Flammeovirga sp. EKP202 TaxID=2770592 RepID=UPI00165FC5C5|nr:RHS repeat-associated core domain-containing protein [Flammeovirga sp. EKP202]MBD0404997.1 hypothetical protein [Flammeovirga sp. EKP202]